MECFPQGVVPDGKVLVFEYAFGLKDAGQAAEGSDDCEAEALEKTAYGGADSLDACGDFYNPQEDPFP